ncbi:MAG: hypothetical protein ACFE7R_01935, partial [Candidatus Hodarchaeota archaeon]
MMSKLLINWKSFRLRGGVLIFAVLLFLSPAIICKLYYTSYPPIPPMGQAEVAITEDTFVSTADDIDHSSESSLRISNVSEGGNNILEIAYLQFSLIPPPAGSYL